VILRNAVVLAAVFMSLSNGIAAADRHRKCSISAGALLDEPRIEGYCPIGAQISVTFTSTAGKFDGPWLGDHIAALCDLTKTVVVHESGSERTLVCVYAGAPLE
jgi:hypothetical protein